MSHFKHWLNLRCSELDWIPVKNYPYNFQNKVFKIIENEDEQFGQIIEVLEDNQFSVWYQDNIQLLKLKDLVCYIDKGTITNRDFCIKNGFKFLKYLKSCDNLEVNISDKDFIKYFSQIVYYNSGP